MTMIKYNTQPKSLTLLFDESPSMFLSLYSSSLNLPKSSVRHALTSTTKRLLIKYHDVQSKIKSLKNSKKPILRYLSIRKAKKALILVLKKTKDAIFRWVTSSLEKYGMCKTHQAGFVSGVV